jgi:P27 family predicted phage terminase small subunit
MPSWLTPEARVLWRRTLRELAVMRVVTLADGFHVAMYCTVAAEFIAAAALVARDGLLVAGRDGGMVANPACRIERDRLVMAHRLGATLGCRRRLAFHLVRFHRKMTTQRAFSADR